MLQRRPFGSLEAARRAAREEWFALPAEEWKIAFARHPRIGDSDALRPEVDSAAAASSAREQAGVDGADATVLRALFDGNREYAARFGYIFIVCATGKSAAQMLDVLRARLTNPHDIEIQIAAEEHAKICDLRIADRVEDARSRARAGAQ